MIFIHPQIQEANQKDVILFLCSKMEERGYITEDYFEHVTQRESKHPTGLPTLPFACAVPHADPIGVKHTGIALAVLQKPVIFNAMDNPRQELEVSLVFLMSFIKNDQIAVLQWISNVLGNQNVVKEIAESNEAANVYRTIQPFLNNQISEQ
jgi:PTS system galactitol-specific IIA component